MHRAAASVSVSACPMLCYPNLCAALLNAPVNRCCCCCCSVQFTAERYRRFVSSRHEMCIQYSTQSHLFPDRPFHNVQLCCTVLYCRETMHFSLEVQRSAVSRVTAIEAATRRMGRD